MERAFVKATTMRRFVAVALVAGLLGAAGATSDQRQTRARDLLNVGDDAPNFKLKTLKQDAEFELASNFGKRPTVLIFGSYT